MVLWLVTACAGILGLGGDETDGATDGLDTGIPADTAFSVDVTGWFASGAAAEDAGPPGLLLTDEESAIGVDHTGFEAPCSAAVSAVASREDSTVYVNYEYEAPDTYSDTCVWTLRYALGPLPAGSWTVQAQGDVASLTLGED